MNRRNLFFVLVLCLLAMSAMPAAAQGIVVPGVDTDPSTLLIDYHRVQVDVENQIATTNVDLQFTNTGQRLAEGTFIFPLPEGAAVDNLIMWVDGVAIEARILRADEAREIYNEIVRRLADPALLEYVGTNAIQANVFPIPPGESRRIQISYSQVLEVDNGLIHYTYPIHATGITTRAVGQMSISVNVSSMDEISNIYSPSHNVAISRSDDDHSFRAGFEASNIAPDEDFSLFYGIATETINVNLLTYRESAGEDGFFMLMVQPPVRVAEDQLIPKDVIIVLDQSGSMEGEKWEQAIAAATYVLSNLNAGDRFNVITFSTGWRVFSNEMESASLAQEAIDWINTLEAEGGTDINGALTTALDIADAERPTTILFLTDGVATEGVVETADILENLNESGRSNVRIFTFGVGDDVDTFLLDAIVRDFRGAGSYVRPGQRIDEVVASLYNKISSPVMTDIVIDFGGVTVELLYPRTMPDLFAGEQLTIVGRYRGDASNISISLRGQVNGQMQTLVYEGQTFPARAGGEPFIARLWATRRIGDLMNTIRLNGESRELVESVISLSLRYGIITPYTSFLIEEDDILTQRGRAGATDDFRDEAESLGDTTTGTSAVDAASTANEMSGAAAPPSPSTQGIGGQRAGGGMGGDADVDGESDGFVTETTNPIQVVGGKTFIQLNGVWTDTTFTPDTMTTQQVVFLSDEYFDLLDQHPELADYFALGDRVIVVVEGVAYEVVAE